MAKNKEKRDEAMQAAEPMEKISFEEWWAEVHKSIPAQHKKEIIEADMKGRGMKDTATTEQWEKALKAYGL